MKQRSYHEASGLCAASLDAPALAGGSRHFPIVIQARRSEAGVRRETIPVGELAPEVWQALTAPRAAFGGVPMDRPCIMGIVNEIGRASCRERARGRGGGGAAEGGSGVDGRVDAHER